MGLIGKLRKAVFCRNCKNIDSKSTELLPKLDATVLHNIYFLGFLRQY